MAVSPSSRRLPAAIFALGFTSFFTDVGSEMVFPLLPAFLVTLGAGPAALGLVEGAADAVSALLKYLSGHWSDRLTRRRPLVLAGYALASFVRPLFALAGSPWHVLAIRVSDRTGKGIRTAPRDALIASIVPKEDSGRAFGVHRAMDHAGAVVGPLVATALLGWGLSVRSVFAWTVVPGVLAVLSVLLVREPRTPAEALAEERAGAVTPSGAGHRTSAPEALASTSTRETPGVTPADGTAPRAPLPARLKSLLALFVLFALGNSTDGFLLFRAKELGTPDMHLPLLWVGLNVSRMVWAARAGAWSDKMPRHRLVVAGWVVYAFTYVGLAFATADWQAWIGFLVYGAFAGLTEPVESALIRDFAPAASRGRAFGLYHGLMGGVAIPAGLLTGGLWQLWGAPAALLVGAGIAAVSAVGLMVWARQAPPASVD